ncbi:MAG: hypothetical protein ACI8W0_002026, partial [Flavobacterium sp.]
TDRPHMFVREIELYIDFLEQQITRTQNPEKRMLKKWEAFCNNLIEGVNYYAELAEKQVLDSNPKAFESSLKKAELTIQKLKNSILQTSL